MGVGLEWENQVRWKRGMQEGLWGETGKSRVILGLVGKPNTVEVSSSI